MSKPRFTSKNIKKLQRTHSTVTGIARIFLIAQLIFCSILLVKAQTDFSFTSDDIFEISSKNSSIRFATNGTYEAANLRNGIWTFQKLYLSNSSGTEKLNLTISATDCDLTIYPYRITPYSYGSEILKWVILRYTLSGKGTQVINLGLDPNNSQLDVIMDGEFIGRNQGWTRSSDGTLTITGANSNVTLWYIGYPEHHEEDGSFLREHYLLIGATTFFSIIVILAITIKSRKKEENKLLNKTNTDQTTKKALE